MANSNKIVPKKRAPKKSKVQQPPPDLQYTHNPLQPLSNTYVLKNGKVYHSALSNTNGAFQPELVVARNNLTNVKNRLSNMKNKVAYIDESGMPCTKCSEVAKRLKTKVELIDPLFDRDDLAACSQNNSAAKQRCLVQKGCERRSTVMHSASKENNKYINTLEPYVGDGKPGTATFCCIRNALKEARIEKMENAIVTALGAAPAKEQAALKAEIEGKSKPSEAMVKKEEEKQTILVQMIAPIVETSAADAAAKDMIQIALSTIEWIRKTTEKRLKQVVDMIHGLEYKPGKTNRALTALMTSSSAAYATSGSGSIMSATSGAFGALYGYARGSTGVITDIIQTITYSVDKVLQLITYILSDPKRAAFVLEGFVMLKAALCASVSKAVYGEPRDVQVGMFEKAANGAKKFTENGAFVANRIFIMSIDKVFNGPIASQITGNLTGAASFALGGLGAAGGFLADVIGSVASDALGLYAQQMIITHFLKSSSNALVSLFTGPCIQEQPNTKTVTTEKTLAEISSGIALLTSPSAQLAALSSAKSRWFGIPKANNRTNSQIARF